MLLLGAIFKCLDPILILAAIESTQNIFLNPPGQTKLNTEIRYSMALGQPSDHLAILNAYREWRFIKATRGRTAANEYAFENLMHAGAVVSIERTSEQMLRLLVGWGLAKDLPPALRYNYELGDPELNLNSDVQPLIFSLLTAGLMPNLAVQVGPVLLQTGSDSKALIHPSSLNSNAGEEKVDKKDNFLGAGPPGTLVTFSSRHVHSGGLFLKEVSVIGPMTGLLFSGKVKESDETSSVLQVDGWLPLKFEVGVAPYVLQLTKCIDNVCLS
jgi:ATP-dependent RNA helicase DHX36